MLLPVKRQAVTEENMCPDGFGSIDHWGDEKDVEFGADCGCWVIYEKPHLLIQRSKTCKMHSDQEALLRRRGRVWRNDYLRQATTTGGTD